MRFACRSVLAMFAMACFLGSMAAAQSFRSPRYFDEQFHPPRAATSVPGPKAIDDYTTTGKLQVGLRDAIRLMLLNNTEVRINGLQYEQSFLAVQRAFGPFDPLFTASSHPQRTTAPTVSTLQGAQTLSDLEQPTSAGYSQTFMTGTNLNIQFNTDRSSTNSTFATFNPSFTSGSTFSLSQSLLRGRGIAVNRAPIVIARRNVKQSRANFEAQINDAILNVINQYWNLVQAQKNLAVFQDSLRLAEESYKRDKRALELGALSPLEIYRSEGTVAQRRLQVIQAEYAIKPLEDQLRRTIGADLDSRAAALDLVLTEDADPAGELVSADIESALEQALSKRPELEGIRQQLANDDTSVQLANNNLKPDLRLSAFFTSNGIGGNQIDSSTGAPIFIPGGFTDSLDQVGSFNFPTYGVSLDLRFPIRNRVAQADLGTALIAKKNDLYQQRLRQQVINQDVRNSVHQLEESKLAMAASATARDLAQKTLAAEQRKYDLGAQTIFFVLDAQNVYEQAKQNFVQAEIAYQTAVASYDRATGNLLERHRVMIDEVVH